jgi:hypothetical protein
VGPDGGVVSLLVMGLMDRIMPPTPETRGRPEPGPVGGCDEAAEAGGLPPRSPPPDAAAGGAVCGLGLSVASATAPPPKLVHAGGQAPWSLRLNTSSRPIRATTVAAHALARRRSEGRQLIR